MRRKLSKVAGSRNYCSVSCKETVRNRDTLIFPPDSFSFPVFLAEYFSLTLGEIALLFSFAELHIIIHVFRSVAERRRVGRPFVARGDSVALLLLLLLLLLSLGWPHCLAGREEGREAMNMMTKTRWLQRDGLGCIGGGTLVN